MRFYHMLSLFAASVVSALPTPDTRASKAPFFILAGDSTTAPSGGWGNGFLASVKGPADGVNKAVGGATTVSVREDGTWSEVLTAVKKHANSYKVIVTIQYGHNDQKVEENISLAEFEKNMEGLARDVRKAGGTPVIVTPLSRRAFDANGVIGDLNARRDKSIDAARAVDAMYLDLNTASARYVGAIGEKDAAYYDRTAGDTTHLNDSGEAVFGRMMADLMVKWRSDARDYIRSDKMLSSKLASGTFATAGR